MSCSDSNEKLSVAFLVMQDAVRELARVQHVSFHEALGRFIRSRAFDALIDTETGVWMEGPVYLLSLYYRYGLREGY